MPLSASLPDFPWDSLEPVTALAATHPDGLVNLSMGTPVDAVSGTIQAALTAAANAPGYPLTMGAAATRTAITRWVSRECRAHPGFDVLPTIGSKEIVAGLPTLLGLRAGDAVIIPEVCYPTYEVGARLAGADTIRASWPYETCDTSRVRLVWINSPANPTGRVLSVDQMRAIVEWARQRHIVVASDECYVPLGWEAEPASVLCACGDRYDGVIAVHSLSKRSNLAGYRAGFVAGDPAIIRELLTVRKHAGMMVPSPVQAAAVAALSDDDHAIRQRERYRRRRAILWAALEYAGFTVEHSEAGLYLWATRAEPCWTTVYWFAERGIVVAPGTFYGPMGDHYVRVAITATDERIKAAVRRLTE